MGNRPLARSLLRHFGNLLVSVIGALLLGLAAWLAPPLFVPLLWAGVPVYLGVLLPRWIGRGERLRRAEAARQADLGKWGFACRDHAGPWLNYIDYPLLQRCEQFAGRYFYGEWLIIHDGLLIVNPGYSSVDLQRGEVRYDFARPQTYAWDGCTPKVPFYWLAILGIPDWWEKRHSILRLQQGQTQESQVFWPLAHPASLVHDALYQYLNVAPLAKHEADRLFFRMLRQAGMVWPLAFAYYLAVRLFGALEVRGPAPANSALRCVTPLPASAGAPALNFAVPARSA
ncbi:conserved membrane hypothetical protein [Pseudomonas sp. 8AS]|uniref:DUF1353 domain-containing protein n=1 Tax=Pseudomonas sp. 8AS TaxID=2653163 RepID=UPI0012F41420|nr:DUF1353 domain-containing protein [Pseudomonas sp. 8AS]VXC37851.1 conserved membrane hypothetical protein [Pseudomonas sp. 8AS]